MANQFIKTPNQECEYGVHEINELKKCMSDPIYFLCNYIRVQHPTKGNVAFQLYDFQKDLVNAINNPEKSWVLALLPRQMGKCSFSHTYINIITKPSKIKLLIIYFLDRALYKEFINNQSIIHIT